MSKTPRRILQNVVKSEQLAKLPSLLGLPSSKWQCCLSFAAEYFSFKSSADVDRVVRYTRTPPLTLALFEKRSVLPPSRGCRHDGTSKLPVLATAEMVTVNTGDKTARKCPTRKSILYRLIFGTQLHVKVVSKILHSQELGVAPFSLPLFTVFDHCVFWKVFAQETFCWH